MADRDDRASAIGIALAEPYVAASDKERDRLTADHRCSACGKSGKWVTGGKGPLRNAGQLNYHRAAAKCQCGFLNFFYVVLESRSKKGEVVKQLARMAQEGEIPFPELERTLDRARAFAHKEDWEVALKACEQAIEIDDQSSGAWYNLGWIYATLGRFEEARDAYLRVIGLPDDFPSAWKNLGVAYHALGQQQAALDATNKFLERFPKDRAALGMKKSYIGALEEASSESGPRGDMKA